MDSITIITLSLKSPTVFYIHPNRMEKVSAQIEHPGSMQGIPLSAWLGIVLVSNSQTMMMVNLN